MDRMELSRVSTMADDDSLDERFTEPGDCEKATLSRSVTGCRTHALLWFVCC